MTLLDIKFGFIGGYPVAGMAEPWIAKMDETLALLRKSGIRAILILTEDAPYTEYYQKSGLRYLHVPMDDGEPASMAALDRSVMFINECVADNQPVAVHCLEGRGRTGLALGAWLGVTESTDGPATIQRLRRLRPLTVLTPAQKECLCRFLETQRV